MLTCWQHNQTIVQVIALGPLCPHAMLLCETVYTESGAGKCLLAFLSKQEVPMCRTLNRIQTRIYPAALHSNQNLLVCAPTGAGKTNIAMLAVLHEIGANMRHGIIQKQDFKVVYVAPMKALAAEVTGAFSRRLGPLGMAASLSCEHGLL